MFRAFNMGIGMVFILDPQDVTLFKKALEGLSKVYEIGKINNKKRVVEIK
jgi:phosphoribosylaminoimidazole (AIR) synthetase